MQHRYTGQPNQAVLLTMVGFFDATGSEAKPHKGGNIMEIGFIGLGQMGAGMAANLVKAGHQVTVFNRTPDKAGPLVAQGARAAASVAEVCHGDAVVTMLADDEAVESVAFGEGGVIANLARSAIHISSSTISVALSESLAKEHARSGQRYVAAPVFGRPEVAAAGQLFVVAAGSSDAISASQPLFEAIGQHLRGLASSKGRESGKAQRQFPHYGCRRIAWRGHGVRRQGGRRPT